VSARPAPLGVIPQHVWAERVKTERIDSLLAAAKRAEDHYRALRTENPRNMDRESAALAAVARFTAEAAELARTLSGAIAGRVQAPKPEVHGE